MPDLQTVQLSVGLLFGVAHLTLWKVLDGQRTRALAWWCLGGVLLGCGWTLAGIPVEFPEFLIFYAPYLLTFLGGLAYVRSFSCELGIAERLPRSRIVPIVVGYVLVTAVCSGLGGASFGRAVVLLLQAHLFGYLSYLAWQLARKQSSRNARWISVTFAGLTAGWLMLFSVSWGVGTTGEAVATAGFGLAALLAGTASAVGSVGFQLERMLNQQLGMVLDSLARKMAEKTLKEERIRLAGILEATDAGTWEWNLQTGDAKVNERWAEIVGCVREEISPLSNEAWERMVHPDDVDSVLAQLDRHLRGEVPHYHCEMRLKHRDGHWAWVEDCGKVTVWTEDGQPLLMQGIHQDITKRRAMEDEVRRLNAELEQEVQAQTAELRLAQQQTEAALERKRRSEAWFRAIFEQAPLGVALLDTPSGRFLKVNPSFAQITGRSVDQLLVSDWKQLTHPEDRDKNRDQHARLRAGQLSGYRTTKRYLRPDGSVVWIDLTLTAMKTGLDEPPRYLAVIQDITSQRRLEAELQAAKQAAEDANQAKSEFLAKMSHEIRTPMNGVIGMTELLRETRLHVEQQRYVEMIRSSGENLLALIDDILDISKIEAGRLEIEWADCQLRALLDELAPPLGLRAEKKGVALICSAAPEVPDRIHCVPDRLRQVLINLAGNAIKFTEQGEVVVRADLTTGLEQEPQLRFTIRDTGIGIATEQQSRLFSTFAQADASISSRYGGTGLGLAISKHLVELMGGQIGFRSELGRGSEFWFTLPLTQPTEAGPTAAKAEHLGGQRLLIVEENASRREVLVEQMTSWGLRAEAYGDGPAALLALVRAQDEGQPFPAAFLDAHLPNMDGLMIARAIRADVRLRATRLVLMTRLDFRGDHEQLRALDFFDRLTKPIGHAALAESLAHVLSEAAENRGALPSSEVPLLCSPRSQGARILVVEDNPVNQQVALAILRRFGFRADAADNGYTALERLAQASYELVLMDVQMPRMDGLQATRRIRDPDSGVRNPHIPIIAMTAAAMRGDRERCIQAGMNDYVTKPISPDSLLQKLEAWLEERSVAVSGVPSGIQAG